MTLNFRNILSAATVASMLFLGAATFTSCGKEGCTDAGATNYDVDATDDDGTCTFESDVFVGTYAMSDDCDSEQNINYTLTISQSSANKANIIVEDFSNFGTVAAEATVAGSVFTISNYSFTTGSGSQYVLNATGTLNGNTLTVVYTLLLNGTTDSCSGSGIKQ